MRSLCQVAAIAIEMALYVADKMKQSSSREVCAVVILSLKCLDNLPTPEGDGYLG